MWTKLVHLVAVLVFFLGCPGLLQADTYKDWTGYNLLAVELGTNLPTGAGVLVAQVEADANGSTEGQPYGPNENNSEFSGKTISYTLGDPPNDPYPYSNHATTVGTLFYGNTSSFSPGVTSITSDLADRWLEEDIYRNGYPYQPVATHQRVANYSWAGWVGNSTTDALNSSILRRVDWLIARDEYIQVVAMNNGGTNYPLLGSSFNAIAVGRSDGNHAMGSVDIDTEYSSGRTRPDLVAPMGATSYATPLVASSVALLVEAGREGGAVLSDDPVESSTTNRAGDTIYNAERAEVIKATLMAGADRTSPRLSYGYTVDTDNGLNSRYGAGELNIYQSYHILAAGEQNSAEDDPGTGGLIGPAGFDYDPQFGGASGSNQEGSYYFSTDLSDSTLTASLVWHIYINGGTATSFEAPPPCMTWTCSSTTSPIRMTG